MNARYYLDKPNHKKETALYLIARVNKRNLKINTQIKIHPKFWDKNKERVRPSYTGSPELNEYLNLRKAETLRLFRALSMDHRIVCMASAKSETLA